MAGGRPLRDGPAYITTSSDDLYNPASGTFGLIRQIHLANTSTSTAVTVSLFIGATGAEAGGTEILKDYNIPIGKVYDLYFPGGLKLTNSDFLVGDASASSSVTATIVGEEYLA